MFIEYLLWACHYFRGRDTDINKMTTIPTFMTLSIMGFGMEGSVVYQMVIKQSGIGSYAHTEKHHC